MNKSLKYGLAVALLVAAGTVYFLSGRSRAVPSQPGECTTIRFEQDTLRLGQDRTHCDWDRLPWGRPSPSFSNIRIRVTTGGQRGN